MISPDDCEDEIIYFCDYDGLHNFTVFVYYHI